MIVTVEVLFSSNKKIGSKIISLGTKHLEPRIQNSPSHTALLINGRWVHESTGRRGVRVISYPEWLTHNTEVYKISLGSREYQELANKYREILDKKYDYLGIFFLGICIIPTFFGTKLPKKNKWESPNKYFCCEVLGYLTGHYYGMSTPIQILSQLLENSNGQSN